MQARFRSRASRHRRSTSIPLSVRKLGGVYFPNRARGGNTMSSLMRTMEKYGLLMPLFTLITSGSIITFSGGLLTFFYFLSIGGTPVGQIGLTSSIARTVVANALFLMFIFLASWLMPILLAIFLRGQLNEIVFKNSKNKISITRIFVFYLLSIGISFLFLSVKVLIKFLGEFDIHSMIALSLSATICAILVFAGRRKDRGMNDATNAQDGCLVLMGVMTSFLSLYPTYILVLQISVDSTSEFYFGILLIHFASILVYAFSFFILITSEGNLFTKLSLILILNSITLLLIVLGFGMFPKLTNRVMELSSIRVERATIILNRDGCEILDRISTASGGRSKSESGEICLLKDVTIQSTLQPAMQVACWRGRNESEKPQKWSFTIPVSYVKSIYKAKYSEQRRSKQPAPEQNSDICSDLPLSNESENDKKQPGQ